MRDNPGGELDSADDVLRRCKKYSLSVATSIPCIDKRTKEGCGKQFTAGQFL